MEGTDQPTGGQIVYAVVEADERGEDRTTRGVFGRRGIAEEYAERLLESKRLPELFRIEVETWPVLTEIPDELYAPGGDVVRHVTGPVVVDADAAQKALGAEQ